MTRGQSSVPVSLFVPTPTASWTCPHPCEINVDLPNQGATFIHFAFSFYIYYLHSVLYATLFPIQLPVNCLVRYDEIPWDESGQLPSRLHDTTGTSITPNRGTTLSPISAVFECTILQVNIESISSIKFNRMTSTTGKTLKQLQLTVMFSKLTWLKHCASYS